MTTKNTSINIKLFECEKCVFRCSKKGDWNRHLLTRKHINATKTTENTSNTSNTSNTLIIILTLVMQAGFSNLY